MVEQHAAGRIHVGKRVLGLAVLLEHAGRDLRVALDELEDRVGGDLGAGGGEVHEGFEAGVRAAQDGVAVAGHDLAGFEGAPEVVFDGGVGEGGADVGLHFEDPAEDFLSCESGEVGVVRERDLEVHQFWTYPCKGPARPCSPAL